MLAEEIAAIEEKVKSSVKDDNYKVDLLIQLGLYYLDRDPSKSLEFSKNALQIAKQLNYDEGVAGAGFNLGLYFTDCGEFENALNHLHRSLEIRTSGSDKPGVAAVLLNIGNAHLVSGNYRQALENYAKAIAIREEINDKKGTADLLTNTGIIYGYQGNYPQALQSHLKALKIYDSLGEQKRMALSYSNIGIIHMEQNNFDDALIVYDRALNISEDVKDFKSTADLYNNIGNVWEKKNDLQKALYYHQKARGIRNVLNDPRGMAESLNNIGNVYTNLKEYAAALKHHEDALELRKQLNDTRAMAESFINLGEVFILIEQFETAEDNLNGALKLSSELGLKNVQRDAHKNLADIYSKTKEFEKAYYHLSQFVFVEKDIANAEISRQLAQMSLQHEIEQRERETELERLKNIELKKAFDSLDAEKQRSESLLLNILPLEIAKELKENGRSEPRSFELVTVMFTDIQNFTKLSEQLSAKELVGLIDTCFKAFDNIIDRHGIEKIKIIGDAYMCAGGIPIANTTNPVDVVGAAIEMQQFMENFELEQKAKGKPNFKIRVGVNSGPLVAGIIGHKKFAYDIWGDTVNVAARMEQTGEVGKVNISGTTYNLVKHIFPCSYRGKIEAKNKGHIDMYFAEAKN